VGFQCLSEDTEILTQKGWKTYKEIRKGDIIKTFNIEKGIIEDKRVQSVFKRKYRGTMYNLKNRIQDQLISPRHKVVRKKFNTNKYVLFFFFLLYSFSVKQLNSLLFDAPNTLQQ